MDALLLLLATGGSGGVLDPYLGIGVPPRFKTLTLLRTKIIKKTLPSVGQQAV